MAKNDQTFDLMAAMASDRWDSVRDGIDRAGDRLRSGDLNDSEIAALGERLLGLAQHQKWEVRKAVAHAVLYLRHYTFDAAIAQLIGDDNSYVQDAARRTLSRRSEITKADLLKDQHGDLMLGWLSDLEARHGTRARDAAMRVAEKFAELIISEAHHEIVKMISPLDASLTNLETSLTRVRIDRDAAMRHVRRSQDRLRLLNAVVKSLRDFHTKVVPEFRGEDVRSMVEEAIGLVTDASDDPDVAVEIEIETGLLIDAHRYSLLQAFSNILQNGLESYDGTGRSPQLLVRAKIEDGSSRVVIEFVDGGCGMSEEAQDDAFQIYSTNKQGGTGFGLPLARKVIQSIHGGRVTLTSTKGEGTVVTVVLPREQEAGDG